MRAPNNKPTIKTEQRLAKERESLLKNSKIPPAQKPSHRVVEMDLQSILDLMLQNEEVQEQISKEAVRRLDTEDSIKNVKSIMSEYFSSFIIMGYDIDGRRTIIKHTQTDRDEDSIIEMLRYVIIQMVGGN